MAGQKLIFVTGGTGNQGGAVARNLVKLGFKVKVLTRNPDSTQSRKLKGLNIEPVKGNLNDVETYRDYVRSAYGVYSVQTFKEGVRKEVEQGKTLASIAAQVGVRHFVYSSVAGADVGSGIPHFESKREIEEHIKKIGLPYTIIRPVSLYENFLFPQVKKAILKGKLLQPTNRDTILRYVASEDVGKVAAQAFLQPDVFLSRTITLAAEELTTAQVAELFSAELHRPVEYKKLPWVVNRFVLGKNIYKMYSWLNQGNSLGGEEEISGPNEFPELLRLQRWIGQNFKNTPRA